MLGPPQQVEQANSDYARLPRVGICVVQEGVPGPVVERRGDYDFSSLQPITAAAAAPEVQLTWTLCHCGQPDDLVVFSAAFVERFTHYRDAVRRYVRDASAAIPLYVPIGEISFLAFVAGQVGWFHPFARGRSEELKVQLIRAAITGSGAMS